MGTHYCCMLNKESLIRILKEKNLSIRELGRIDSFKFNEKTVRRGYVDGASVELLRALCKVLNCRPEEISNYYDNDSKNFYMSNKNNKEGVYWSTENFTCFELDIIERFLKEVNDRKDMFGGTNIYIK